MSAPVWMPFYVRDFVADTIHLTDRQQGAYILLICHYWLHGGLPNDDAQLCLISRQANVDDWLTIKAPIAALFRPVWRHKRIDEELSKASVLAERRRKAGQIGGRKSSSNRQAIVEQSSSYHSHIHKKKEDGSLRSPSKKEAGSRGTRIPADWQPDLAEALRLGLTLQEASRQADVFRDYWRGKAGEAGIKLDWPATWRNWCRRAAEQHQQKTRGRNERPTIEERVAESPTAAAFRILRGG